MSDYFYSLDMLITSSPSGVWGEWEAYWEVYLLDIAEENNQ